MKYVDAIQEQLNKVQEEENKLRELLLEADCRPGKDWPLGSVIKFAEGLINTYRNLDKEKRK